MRLFSFDETDFNTSYLYSPPTNSQYHILRLNILMISQQFYLDQLQYTGRKLSMALPCLAFFYTNNHPPQMQHGHILG